jgi:ABC-type spermidine/putrescine transport system permease subunit II
MVISVTIGTLAAFGLVRSRFKGRNVVFTLILLPMLMPALILAVALLLFFNFAGVELGVMPVIIGHVVVTLPFVVLIVSLRLFGFDRRLEEAARDLGAHPVKVLRHVTLPLMAPGLMAAALFSFLISWDEVLIAFYNIDNRSTLPIYIWTQLRHRITMDLVALGTLLSALTALLVVVAWFVMRDRKPKRASETSKPNLSKERNRAFES